METINVYHSIRPNGRPNFGDELSKPIVDYLTHQTAIITGPAQSDLIAVGSVLEKFLDTDTPRVVWGSGLIKDAKKQPSERLTFAAVRGELTRKALGLSEHLPLGDPGLLANLVYAANPNKTGKIGIVPHYVEKNHDLIQQLSQSDQFVVIDVERHPEEVIADITSMDMILSSSLHGLIIADSFGIPNYWFSLTDKVTGNGFKFLDHFSAISRSSDTAKIDLAVAIEDTNFLHELKGKWTPVYNLEDIQKNLIDAFPNDINSTPTNEKNTWITDFESLTLPTNESRVMVYSANKTLLEWTRTRPEIQKFVYELNKLDYVLNAYHDGFSYFVKRADARLKSEFQRSELGLPYVLDETKVRPNHNLPAKLVVVFSGVADSKWHRVAATGRMFVNYFSDFHKYLLKNTYVLRILDFNLNHGSAYRNTENYPNFEYSVQSLIKQVAQQLNVERKHIVLYGPSKGGSGALYHGALGDYKTVAVDPIVNYHEYNEDRKDIIGVKSFIEEDWTNSLNDLLQRNTSNPKVVIDNRYVTFNYESHQLLRNIVQYDLQDETITEHVDVSPNAVAETLMWINRLLLEVS